MSERNSYIPPYTPENSIRVSCIQYVNLFVANIERSQQWYKKVFGAQWTEADPRQLKLGTCEVHIAVRSDSHPNPLNHFAVELENWHTWVANLHAIGESFLAPPNASDKKIRGFVCDPDNNRIEVMWHDDWHHT